MIRMMQTILLMLLMCLLGSCSEPTLTKSAGHGKLSVVRMEGGDWGYPTPFAHYPRGPGVYKVALIFDSLLERGEKELIPWLAKSWTLSHDKKTYTFVLRNDVIWHDGRPLTAEDVAFSLMYMQIHPTPWALVYGLVESAVATEPHTVTVTVKQPGVTCLYAIGHSRIIPKHIWQNVDTPKTFTTPLALMGSGPFCLTDYSREHGTYRFQAFDRFWGPKPRVSSLEFVPVSDPVLAYEAGQIDIMKSPPDLLPRYKQNPHVDLLKCPAFWGYRLLMNMKRHPRFKDKRMRHAIRHSLDLEAMVQNIARGAAVPGMAGALPPDHVMFTPNQRHYDHAPHTATALLRSMGYKAGDPRLSFQVMVSSRDDKEVRLGEMIIQQLNQAGFQVSLVSLNQKTRDARVRDYDYDLAVFGHGGWGRDMDHFKYRYMKNAAPTPSLYGYAGYDNPELSDLFHAQNMAFNPSTRLALSARIQTLVADELPDIPLFYTQDVLVCRKDRIRGLMTMFDHHNPTHSKLTWLDFKEDLL